MKLSLIDILVFLVYLFSVVALGIWVSREKKGHIKDSSDYFLAGRALPWWAVGASLIASNISAEQVIGMSGSGYAIGLAIASYEWMAAITLIIVAKYFLPIFLKKKIYTMPQFLESRYNRSVRTSLALFWLLVYIFINLTSVLYLGALALKTLLNIPLLYGVIGLALFSSLYTIYGGLKAVAWTDVLQVTILILGGLMTSYLALKAIGAGKGFIAGMGTLVAELPDKFDMVLKPGQIMIPQTGGGVKDAFLDLPGIAVLLGGMWIANLFYWGCNQYITQRALAAKNIRHARTGLAFAGYLKLLMPLIVVIPGIAAYYLIQHPALIPAGAEQVIGRPDNAYPWLLNTFIPTGLKGLTFAALIAAIVSSLSSMVNSTATLFSMDIYKPLINRNASEKQLVSIGRIASFIAIIIAVGIAPQLASLDQAYQYIQEFTGFFSPGIFCIFLYGLFWKKTRSRAALWGAVISLPLSVLFKYATPGIPFMERMGIVFLICSVFVILASSPLLSTFKAMGIAVISGAAVRWMSGVACPGITPQHQSYIAILIASVIFYLIFRNSRQVDDAENAITIDPQLLKTSPTFNSLALGICLILTALYILFW